MKEGRHCAIDAPDMEALVERTVAGIGADLAALRPRGLRGVVLCGGYARGEGGVSEGPDGARRLSNDLDFYVVAEDGADVAAVAGALAPVARRWSAETGVDVDFPPPKTVRRMLRDERRVMIQELVRGYQDAYGEPGETMFAPIRRLPPSELPWTEAARFVANRGYGLLLAMEGRDPLFAARNVAKCVLGAGDARLVIRGAYRWRAEERAKADGTEAYAAALAWKFRPGPTPPVPWEEARQIWLAAARDVFAAGRERGEDRRTLREAARWIARRRTAGPLSTLGRDCVSRLARRVAAHVEGKRPVTPALRRDFETFN